MPSSASDIAWQVLKEGPDVRWYIEAEKDRQTQVWGYLR
jgi:hypothetical protein